MFSLVENTYGKSRVRLVQVKRHAQGHDFGEWTIDIALRGDFESCFVDGDNSKILPTDTMKNTVYSLARKSSAKCMEEFGIELIDRFLHHNPQVTGVEVRLAEKSWEHLTVDGKPHPTTFLQASGEIQVADLAKTRNSVTTVWSGLEHLIIMKTSGSAFAGFIKDSLTTLPESTDRLFGTDVGARWRYAPSVPLYPALRAQIREILLPTFAEHDSKSVQHTLYAMAVAVLERVPEVEEIELTMPNKHCLLVDLSRFGQDNPNEVFVPIDEPHGTITASVSRKT